jgi:HlyD family secretion protein
MKKTSWAYAAGGAVAAVALLAWAFAPRPVEVEVANATQGRFEATIDEDAKTRLRDRYVVSAPLAGQLSRIALREGDTVNAGTVVATITPVLAPMLDARTVRDLQLRVEIAQAQEQRALARIEQARVGTVRAKNEVQRSEQLAPQGFVSATKLENDRLAALAAQKELDAATQEQHIARHEVEQARAALMTVRSPGPDGARAFTVRAPVNGRVLRVGQGSETAVALGTPLLELGDTQRLEVVAELLTTDALQALPGSRVLIERWGGTGSLQGRVRQVEPAAYTKVSALGVEEQRVKVLIDITSPQPEWAMLGDGFRVGVRIVTLALDGAVQVPLGAVFPLAGGEGETRADMAVFVLDGDRVRLTRVEVGERNGQAAWIRQGLRAGARVVIYPPATVQDGAKVVVRTVR